MRSPLPSSSLLLSSSRSLMRLLPRSLLLSSSKSPRSPQPQSKVTLLRLIFFFLTL